MTDAPAEAPKGAEDIRALPVMLQVIAKRVGLPAAQALANAVGGVETYIPVHPAADHPLARLIGLDKLTALSLVFGGTKIIVPRGAQRNLKVVLADTAGSTREVALATGCTQRYVKKVRAEIRGSGGVVPRKKRAADPDMPDLFASLEAPPPRE